MNAAQEMRQALNKEDAELERCSRIRINAQNVAFAAMETYKREHLKWWKRMDGTPILNDLPVVMANAFVEALLAQGKEAQAVADPERRNWIATRLSMLATNDGVFKDDAVLLIEAARIVLAQGKEAQAVAAKGNATTPEIDAMMHAQGWAGTPGTGRFG